MDNFFDLGGGSLLAFEAAALIGVQAQEIYDNPTAEQLERVLLAIKTDDEAEKTNINVNELIKHNSSILHTTEAKYVLLTGATGYLGSHILRELLRRQMNVVCLVRDKEKLKNTLKYYFPKEHEYFRYRVRIGDIAEPKLGLSDEEYDQLLKKVDMVLEGEVYTNGKKLCDLAAAEPITFYISSISSFVDNTERYLKRVVSRDLYLDTQYDVGVDNNDFYPISFNEVKQIIEQKQKEAGL